MCKSEPHQFHLSLSKSGTSMAVLAILVEAALCLVVQTQQYSVIHIIIDRTLTSASEVKRARNILNATGMFLPPS